VLKLCFAFLICCL